MLETPAKTFEEGQDQLIRDSLERVLVSRAFSGSPRLSHFLRYTVEHTLRGEFDELKEVCIGIAVFGKTPSYDAKNEPIVRVEARRLRTRLDDYYADAGRDDEVRISLPKGSYQAHFELTSGTPLDFFSVESATPEAPNNTGSNLVVEPPITKRGRSSAQTFIVVSLIAFCLGACAVLLSRLSKPKVLVYSHVSPLTSYPGNEMQPAISHDGRQLAFVWGGDNGENFDIYVKLLDIGTPVRLTTNAAHDLAPRWSPDDRYLSFLRVTEEGIAVYVIPSLGGAERKVADLHMGTTWRADALQVEAGTGGMWSADGKDLIVTDQAEADSGTLALFAIPLDGSPRRRLTSPPSLIRDFNAVTSHDGRHLAFVRETSNTSGDLYVSDLDGTQIKQITFDRMGVRGVAWTPDDRALVFASNRGGAYELWQVPANGGTAQSIATKGFEVTSPDLADDGRILAYTSTTQNWNIWRAPIVAAEAASSPPIRLIASLGRNDSPRYSPDGRRIAFISDRSGSWELWVSDSEGHELRQITSFGGSVVGTPHWSPDGQYLIFDARPNGRSVIFVVASTGGTPQPIVEDMFENKKPNWSRDGHSVYYTSNRGGKAQLWRSGVHGEHPIRLTSMTCNDSAESADGKYVYFESDQNGIYRLPIAGGAPEVVTELAKVSPSRYFDVLDQIYFLEQENAPRLIRQFDPASHKLSTIGSIERQLVYGTPSLSISPDHRFILYAQQDNSSSQIMALRK